MNETKKTERLMKWRSNLIWILFAFLAVYIIVGSGLFYIPWEFGMEAIRDSISDGCYSILDYYTSTIGTILALFLLTWLVRPSRYIWKSFLLPRKSAAPATEKSDILADFYGRSRNSYKMLGWGLLIGFLMNGFCILCAVIHGDIKLYFESSVRQIPLLLFALVSVLIQSSSEELWCRGFLYERIHERHPLWVAVLINGVLFGALHIFNDGATAISILEISVCGVSFALLYWYSGSIWIVMGLHTAWNFTQAFLFGLPNSGLVSEVSLFHLDASTGISNLIYDFSFGVEGTLPGFFVNTMLGVVVLILAARDGRLKELKMNQAEMIMQI